MMLPGTKKSGCTGLSGSRLKLTHCTTKALHSRLTERVTSRHLWSLHETYIPHVLQPGGFKPCRGSSSSMSTADTSSSNPSSSPGASESVNGSQNLPASNESDASQHSSNVNNSSSHDSQAAAGSDAEARTSGPTPTSSSQDDPSTQAAKLSSAQKAAKFTQRVGFGLILGVSGAGVIAYGQLPFLGMILFVVFHATKEFYGFLTSQGISKGMTPPPPIVTHATTILCLSMAVISYFYKSRTGTVLAVSVFLVLMLQVLSSKKPKFSQLASSVFGIFYCGE